MISRQALLDEFQKHFTVEENMGIYALELPAIKQEVHCVIMGLPSTERTGRWTHVYDENEKLFFRNKWVCSACGKSNTYGMTDFCPCCGAMMENSTRLMKEAKE